MTGPDDHMHGQTQGQVNDAVLQAISDLGDKIMGQALAIARIEVAVQAVPKHSRAIDDIKTEQAQQRGAVNMLKWLFPATLGAVSAAVAVASYLSGGTA